MTREEMIKKAFALYEQHHSVGSSLIMKCLGVNEKTAKILMKLVNHEISIQSKKDLPVF